MVVMAKKNMTAAEALNILSNAQGKDFYTVEYQNAISMAIDALREKIEPPAHWIFSGDEDDYDGYYINCSKCGMQRKVYDRDYERDVPVSCPNCGVSMNLAAWEVKDIVSGDGYDDESLYEVTVIHDNGHDKRPYTMTVRARREDRAREKALHDVTFNRLHKRKYDASVYVESVIEVE
jgi:hypothetical protein